MELKMGNNKIIDVELDHRGDCIAVVIDGYYVLELLNTGRFYRVGGIPAKIANLKVNKHGQIKEDKRQGSGTGILHVVDGKEKIDD